MDTPGLREMLRIARRNVRSLRFTATVAVASFLVMISVLLSGLFMVYVQRGEREAVARTAADWATLLTAAVAEGVVAGDPGAVGRVVTTVRADPRIAYLEVRGASGELAAWREPGPGADASVLEVEAPVRAPDGGETVGTVRFGFDRTRSEERLAELRGRIAASTLAMILLGTLGTMFLVGTIVSPVQALARAADRVAEGDFEVRIESSSRDEVGRLAAAFNGMVDRLRDGQERQRSWNRELADRVREKTREIDRTRAHLSNIVENVGASLLVADLDGTIVTANSHSTRVHGTQADRIVGRSLDEFRGDGGHRLDAVLPMLDSGRGAVTWEARVGGDGENGKDLLVTCTLLRDPLGTPAGILQVAKDVTPLKEMERRLVTTERLTAMGEMAGEIGHELNNYLMAIGGRAELIPLALSRGDQASLERARVSAEMIVRQVAEMRTLTDGLLESARTESSPVELDLNRLVTDTVEFVRPQNRFDAVELSVETPDEELPVRADPQQLRQVLLNLLANGADAVAETPARRGTLRVATWHEGDRVGFRVTDDGAGIAPAARERMFEPHFTTKRTGHGFGLAVCHRVVANHGGRIAVESVPGEGTTFTVELQRVSGRPAARAVPSSP